MQPVTHSFFQHVEMWKNRSLGRRRLGAENAKERLFPQQSRLTRGGRASTAGCRLLISMGCDQRKPTEDGVAMLCCEALSPGTRSGRGSMSGLSEWSMCCILIKFDLILSD